MQATFKGGVKLKENREFATGVNVRVMDPPRFLVFPMLQHVGIPSQPVVSVGQRVLLGQKIAEGQTNSSSHVHASVSGRVIAIEPRACTCAGVSIVIENDHRDTPFLKSKIDRSYKDMTPERIVSIVKEAGIVGMGGMGVPSFIKLIYDNKEKLVGKKIRHLVINGAESEPYVTCDRQIMIEDPEEVIYGIKTILWKLRLHRAYIGIKKNDAHYLKRMSKIASSVKHFEIKVVLLRAKYPQGYENKLIEAVIGESVPRERSPLDIGVLVFNVGTVCAISRAVRLGTPMIERMITVMGNVNNAANFRVRLGTPVSDVLEFAQSNSDSRVILGGPMTGVSISDTSVPVIKTTSAVMVMDEKSHNDEGACINCGRCVSVCPSQLIPTKLKIDSQNKNIKELERCNLHSCVECGSCSYVCPAKIKILQYIRKGKELLTTLSK